MHRFLLVVATLAAIVTTPGTITAQNLFFSKDGQIIREVTSVPPSAKGGFSHVRAVTYDAATGKAIHVVDLEADTWFLSATTDGSIAIVSIDRDRKDARVRILRVDLETGQTQQLPSTWFDEDDHNPHVQISGDGLLVSSYSEEGPKDSPEVVSVYRWPSKGIVAKQMSGFHAGGIDWGGVTSDGRIDFGNNRAGSRIVDPKTGQTLVSYGPLSVRSPNGAWVIEFPNPDYGSEEKELPILNGMDGERIGKLELSLTDEEANWWWQGAFCGGSGRFIAAGPDEVFAFEVPSGTKLASFPPESWKDPNTKTKTTADVACSPTGNRVAIRSGARLTIHDLK
jgi:hypothetical protein